MKPRSVKSKINRMITVLGDKPTVARTLDVTVRYIDMMLNNKVPGKFLYRRINDVHDALTE